MPLSVSVAKTDQGLKVVQPLSSLVLTFASVRNGRLPKSTAEKLLTWIENCPKLARELAPYNLSRIRLRPESEPMTLDEFAGWSQKRLERLNSAQSPTSK